MNDKPILLCFGTRPEWLKLLPIVNQFNTTQLKLLFTGQHPDLLRDVQVNFKIDISDAGVNTNRLDYVISKCMLEFPNESFRAVIVQGDTASALGCALAAFNRNIPIIYVESGLRSNNLQHPYPEEGYRQMISRLASINLAPTELSHTNLLNEKVIGEVHTVGNTVLDNLVNIQPDGYGTEVLVTLHRRENHENIKEWFTAIEELANEYLQYTFILPIHPNENVQKHRSILNTVKVVPPLPHDALINILKGCRLVITDSGGIQEEGVFFNRKILVCRKVTERPEGIYTGHILMCPTPMELKKTFKLVENDPHINTPCPYGDGTSAKKIADIINTTL